MSFNLELAKKIRLTDSEIKIFRSLSSAEKIQDFLVELPSNLEKQAESLRSPREALAHNTAHCIEGALIASLAFWLHGERPLLMDLKSDKRDDDHVIAPFKVNGFWGAVSKSNRPQLRYRDPIYRSLRELAVSYFHEYFMPDGSKTLVSYSRPLNLKTIPNSWTTSSEDLWYLDPMLNKQKHYDLAPKSLKNPRKADPIEVNSNKLTDF